MFTSKVMVINKVIINTFIIGFGVTVGEILMGEIQKTVKSAKNTETLHFQGSTFC